MSKFIAQAVLIVAILALGLLFLGDHDNSIKKGVEDMLIKQVETMKDFEGEIEFNK